MMTKNKAFGLSVVAAGLLAGSGSALADSTWKVADCNSSSSTNCAASLSSGTAAGTTVTIKAYYADTAISALTQGTFVGGASYMAVQSAESGALESNTAPHHAMDNYGIYTAGNTTYGSNSTGGTFYSANGNATQYVTSGNKQMTTTQKATADKAGGADYAEMLYLNFNDTAVSLTNVASNGYYYSNSNGVGDADFQVYAYIGGTAGFNLGSYSATDLMTSADWKLVAAETGDFKDKSSQSVGDGSVFSSYWVITTAFAGDSNDSFKLMQFTAGGCAYTVSGGACTPPPPPPPQGGGVPEPTSLALFAAAAMGAGAVRRRRAGARG